MSKSKVKRVDVPERAEKEHAHFDFAMALGQASLRAAGANRVPQTTISAETMADNGYSIVGYGSWQFRNLLVSFFPFPAPFFPLHIPLFFKEGVLNEINELNGILLFFSLYYQLKQPRCSEFV